MRGSDGQDRHTQALASVYRRNIQRLTQTFVTLSLEDIAQVPPTPSPRDPNPQTRDPQVPNPRPEGTRRSVGCVRVGVVFCVFAPVQASNKVLKWDLLGTRTRTRTRGESISFP